MTELIKHKKDLTKNELEQEWKKQVLIQLSNMQEHLDSISKEIGLVMKQLRSEKLDNKRK